MWKVFLLFSCIFLSKFVSGQDYIGDPCIAVEANDTPGTCKQDYLCDYVDRLINIEKKKPTDCFINTTMRVVCCPIELSHTGILGRAFLDSQNGLIVSDDITMNINPQQILGLKSSVKYSFAITQHGSRINNLSSFIANTIRRYFAEIRMQNIEWYFARAHYCGTAGGALQNYTPFYILHADECRYDGQLPLICCKRENKDSIVNIRKRISVTASCPDSSTQRACIACHEFSNPQPYVQICPESNTLPRIAFGEQTSIEDFPHMVVLGCRNNKKTKPDDNDIAWIGAGSLISTKFVLTAAHVLHESTYGAIKFALLSATNKTDVKSGIFRYILNLKQHKLYATSTHSNDIALVELNYEVPITKFSRPACLPVPGLIPSGVNDRGIIAGWGQTGQHNATSMTLKKGNVQILSESKCRKQMSRRGFAWDHKTMLCASSPTADACQGDSGGPLMGVIHTGDPTVCGYYVAGIISWGKVCGANEVGAYTNVKNDEYLEWIMGIVWPDTNKSKP